MLEYRLKPEGGLVVCDLGGLPLEDGQTVECALRLTGVLPERRVAVAVEALEGDRLRGVRMYTVPPHHGDGPRDVSLTGLRFYLPGGVGAEALTLRADAHYIDRGDRCLLA